MFYRNEDQSINLDGNESLNDSRHHSHSTKNTSETFNKCSTNTYFGESTNSSSYMGICPLISHVNPNQYHMMMNKPHDHCPMMHKPITCPKMEMNLPPCSNRDYDSYDPALSRQHYYHPTFNPYFSPYHHHYYPHHYYPHHHHPYYERPWWMY